MVIKNLRRLCVFNLLFLISFLGENRAFALTGSSPALDSDWNSVVLIKTEDRDETGYTPSYCNATILSDQILVTAAHCVFRSYLQNIKEIEIQIGKYKFITLPDGSRKRVGYNNFYKANFNSEFYFLPQLKSKLNHSGLNTKIGPHEDLAVIVLKNNLTPKTKDQNPGLPLSEMPEIKVAQIIPQKYLNRIPRWANYIPTSVSINFLTEMGTDFKRQSTLNQLEKNSSGYLESTSNSRLEEGDSGSPLFIRIASDWYLTGIAKGRASSIFSNWDVFVLLDEKICSIANENTKLLSPVLCHH